MANFITAYNLTMAAEGGYVNNPADRGGETFKGISRKNNPKWNGWITIDAVKATHPSKLNAALNANATLLSAIQLFYQINYWNVNQTGSINDQQIANQVFDTSVNCGTGRCAQLLQQAANVTVDKMIGPDTLAVINSADAQALYNKFITIRKEYYLSLIAKNPGLAEFKKSWFSRLWPYKLEMA